MTETFSASTPLAHAANLLASGRWHEALAAARDALAIRCTQAEAWYVCGRALKELGERDAGLACYRRGLALEPANPTLLTSLGTLLYQMGELQQALGAYGAALRADPEHAPARRSLATLRAGATADPALIGQLRDEARRLHESGELREALKLHRQALRVAPQVAGIWLSAGLLANELGEQWTALSFFEEAARLNPTLLPAIEAARRICVAAGLLEQATRYSDQAYALKPAADIPLARALAIAAIQPSAESLAQCRREYEDGLDAALRADLHVESPGALLGMSAFFLAFHGEKDRLLQVKSAQLLSRAVPPFTAGHCRAPRARTGRIRIGFVSAFFHSHSIAKTSRGLIERLSRERFEVVMLRITPSRSDEVTELIRRAADRCVDLDPDYRVAREQIAALELDLLFFQDIGMEPVSSLLAHARLAPVQCVSFGHPDTTGIPTIDYFISNDLFEPPGAEAHYSEKLFLLRDLPTLAYYHRPPAPAATADRAAFGLHERDHVYACPQTLFKLHPQFDELLGGILRADPDAVLVLIRGQYEHYTAAIRARFARTLADVTSRIVFLDPQHFPRYLQLLTTADVCLDTLHFNGMNTSLEALAMGTPVVTLPGSLQRGRHTQAMYRTMGIDDCIARDRAHYVEIALRLGRDREYRRSLGERIRERNAVLFENRRVVEEFERFFVHVTRAQASAAGTAP
jgi:protein O-GlcNAc transferase